MLRGLYTSVSGMRASTLRVDVAADAVANAQTTGYKPGRVGFSAFEGIGKWSSIDAAGLHLLGPAVVSGVVGQTSRADTQGSLMDTGNPLDVAISGKGYFQFQGSEGTLLSRDGAFSIDNQGYLTSRDGHYVLSSSGSRLRLADSSGAPIAPSQVSIASNGVLTDTEDNIIGQIGLVDASADRLERVGDNFYKAAEGEEPATLAGSDVNLRQGSLEMSATSLVDELTETMKATQSFKLNQRAFSASEETLSYLIENIAKSAG